MIWRPIMRIVSIGRSKFIVPSAASALAKHGAQLRRQATKATKDAKTAALRADNAAGRISNLGWKQ